MTDRELDARLAEALDLPCHAMSIARGVCKRPYSEHPRTLVTSDHEYVPTPLSRSRDWDGMGLVLEAMRAEGWTCNIYTIFPKGWQVEMKRAERPNSLGTAKALPRAVAEAALKAVEG